MIRPVTRVAPGEQSEAVANLHAALQALGHPVGAAEAAERRAGPETARAVAALHGGPGAAGRDGLLLPDELAARLNALLGARNLLSPAPRRDRTVAGTVTAAGGRPARGLLVTAYDQGLRTRQPLGTAETDRNGRYLVAYAAPRAGRAGTGGADLLVEVTNAAGTVLHTSGVRFKAGASTVVDVKLPAGTAAEFDAVAAAVATLLEGQDVTPATLEDDQATDDIGFAANETGWPRDTLAAFAVAHRLAGAGRLPAPFWYALLRTGTLVPGLDLGGRGSRPAAATADALSRVPGLPAAAAEAGLRRAVAGHLVAAPGRRLAEWMRLYAALQADHAGHEDAPARRLAAVMGLADWNQVAFAHALNAGGGRDAVLARLRDAGTLSAKQLDAAGTVLALHDLVLGDIGLVQALRTELPGAATPHALARLAPADWERLVARAGKATPDFVAGNTAAERRTNYAALLHRRVALAHPTAAFGGRLARAGASALDQAPRIAAFIEAHPEFELGTTSVDGFLRNHASRRFAREGARGTPFAEQLKAVQRVFRLLPEFDGAHALLADGIHSAAQVHRMGRTRFVDRYGSRPGFTAASAAAAWHRAADTQAAVATLVGELRATANANRVHALASHAPALDTLPDWSGLFGPADACACEDCLSIFSPAAYLADLLKWLGARRIEGTSMSARDVLFRRRPDLGYLELGCDNTTVELPYVDLVCELLEDRVAVPTLFTLPGTVALAAGPAAPALRQAVAAAVPADPAQHPVTLSDAARVHGPDPSGAWILRDGAVSYLAAPANGGFAVSVLRQTHGSSAELMAGPRYVNGPAYQVLGSASFPMALPFDLYADSVRAYLSAAGLTRAEVMAVFRGTGPGAASALDIAQEALGIAPNEAPLVLHADPAHQHAFWGEADNPATLAVLGRVDVFLRRTGLDFEGLQALLSMRFVNPGGTVAVRHLDGSCDLAQKRLQPLDAPALDRMHRFLRLWRRLGWAMWEVDLVIGTAGLGGGKLDADLLLRLQPFLQLRARSPSLSVEQLCALFDDVSTVPKFTATFGTPAPSLYEALFLNTRTSGPVDPDFAVASVSGPTPKAMEDRHLPRILAALRVKAPDLALLRALPAPGTAAPAIDGGLSLHNLSFLFRHALFARALGLGTADWTGLLRLLGTDPFADPAAAWRTARLVDRMKAAGFSVDQLGHVLAADPAARAALPPRVVGATLDALKASLAAAAAAADPRTLPSDAAALRDTVAAGLAALGWDPATAANALAALDGSIELASAGPAVPAITLPPGVPARYEPSTGLLRFRGVMSPADRLALLSAAGPPAVLADPAYQAAVQELFELPRLLVRLLRPAFTAPLPVLPAAVRFGTLDGALAARIAFDADRGVLSFFGVMTRAERAALAALSADPGYGAALAALFAAPRAGTFPPERLWLATDELGDLPLAAARLAAGLAHRLSTDQVERQLAAVLGLTPVAVARLVTAYPLFGPAPGRPLLAELLDPAFTGSGAGATADTFPGLFDAVGWLHRVATVLRTVAATDADLAWMADRPADKGILDLSALPVTTAAAQGAVPDQVAALLGLAEIMALHHGWSGGPVSLPGVIDRLVGDPAYGTAAFAADLEALAGWPAADGAALCAGLDLPFPAGYRTAEGWQRLVRAAEMVAAVSGSAAGLLALGRARVGAAEDEALRAMLRAQYSDADWLTVNRTVQDGLRERKRDGLVAFLLARGAPADAPTSPWTDADDLFDHLLVDTQVGACMPTTRVVQAYCTVQLFVQRCLLGLEPDARASVEEDGDWAEWDWMKQYRLWEANRRVFAYPENYAEPELRRDKSELFTRLEDAIVQSGVTVDQVERAFLDYLQGLDDVSQLEIAGTYYDDQAATLHVFGRTAGGDPRLHYCRQFVSGRRWTPWSKVDLDIKGDYLTPFVLHGRLYLVWLEFQGGKGETQTAPIPSAGDGSMDISGDGGAQKTMSVFLAISELRNGRWTTKRLADAPFEVESFSGSYDDGGFLIVPLDLTWLPEALFPGGVPAGPVPGPLQWLVAGEFLLVVEDRRPGHQHRQLFQMAGCRGYPEAFDGELVVGPVITSFQHATLVDARDVANASSSDDPATTLAPAPGTLLPPVQILGNLPSAFKVSYPHQLSLFDRLVFLFGVLQAFGVASGQQLDAAHKAGPLRPGRHAVAALLGTFGDWFYADGRRTFHVRPELWLRHGKTAMFYEDIVAFFTEVAAKLAPGQWPAFAHKLLAASAGNVEYRLRFATFYHPLTCRFISELYGAGIPGLLSRATQFADAGLHFAEAYAPAAIVDPAHPRETVVFDDPAGPYAHGYASYNWELFFFAPVMIAQRLSQNQQFADAMRWFHHVFDPTGGHDRHPLTGAPVPAPQKYWTTKPFFLRQSADTLQQRLETLMTLLADDPAHPTPPAVLQGLRDAVADWRHDPFDPHLVARARPVAYQKFAVMKYLDNLLAWGDQQFTLDTMESVNVATQLYVLAGHILGRRPATVPPAARPVAETFNELDGQLDAFSNALVQFENLLPPLPGEGGGSGNGGGGSGGGGPSAAGLPAMLYFCIPQNARLVGYWDVVEDRLHKIRHCLNIDGVYSPPVLFPPPIDPMALVRATAGGGGLSAALAELDAPPSFYRFASLLQTANEVVGDLRTLGATLLTALEKKDAEALAQLRQGQEVSLLQAVRQVRQQQLDDARIGLAALRKTQELTAQRHDYYAGREFMNVGEKVAASLNTASLAIDAGIAVGYALSGGLKLVPEFMIGAAGFGGTPTANASTGGSSFGGSAEDAARTLSAIATALDKGAALSAVIAGYRRRMDDWEFQARSAAKELEQVAQQLLSAEKRIETAETELNNQDLQIAGAQAVNAFMLGKYTGAELYQWQVGQLSQTFFASYNLACGLARQAERAFRFELGVENTSFIRPGYWNSLRGGLGAGEALQLDLRRMEGDYRAQNRREFECVKHVSLAQLDPRALAELKGKGSCRFDLPEELFDLDFPGHYFRRIKTVSLSIPCVAGPYTGVAATLRLLRNSVRVSTAGTPYEHANDGGVPTDDDRFRSVHVRTGAVATSGGQNDAGLFELNFRDERYLPFEGAGAISSWQVELMDDPALRQFPYSSISDVVVHLRYTAREDAGEFRARAKAHLRDAIAGTAPQLPQWRLFDLVREFPTEWYAMLHPPGGGDQVLRLPVTPDHFPFLAQGKAVHLRSATLVARNARPLSVALSPPFEATDPKAGPPGTRIALGLPKGADVYSHGGIDGQDAVLDGTVPWTASFLASGTLAPSDIAECYLVVGYTLQ